MRGPDHVDPVTGERTGAVDNRTLEEVRRDAYQRGVADERARHKRNPLVTLLIALCAVLGVAVVGLAVWKGSFSGAGQTLDRTAEEVTEEARGAASEVADETGEALQDTGRTIESRGEAEQGAQPAQAQPQGGAAPGAPAQ